MKTTVSASRASVRGFRRAMWAACCLLLLLGGWCCDSATAAAAAATSPDSAGLVGSSPERPTLPYKLWARAPKSALKPRRRDLHEATLRALLGEGFEARWMRTRPAFSAAEAAEAQPAGAGGRIKVREEQEGPRESVSRLAELSVQEALPDDLPPDVKELVRAWLVQRATCPVRYIWTDLGPYFWPRWVRRGNCAPEEPTLTTGRNSSVEEGGSTEAAPAHPRSCSWPPGLKCVPSPSPKVLQLLHWHCRLRKSAHTNSVWVQAAERKKKRRKRFRCQWLKVPYPVPNDCRCVV